MLVGACASSPAEAPAPTPATSTAPAAPLSKVGETTDERENDLRSIVAQTLYDQAQALLRNDEAGYLQPVGSDAARAELTRRYRNLTAMRATGYSQNIQTIDHDPGAGQWKTTVRIGFCFLVAKCEVDSVVETMMWADAEGGPRLMSVAAPGKSDKWYGDPQPWELSDLHVATGERTVVATTAEFMAKLPELLREAEKATAVADAFGTSGTYGAGGKPDAYRVYLAGKKEWTSWYGGGLPKWAAGYALPIGDRRSDVVLNNANGAARTRFLDDMLRHEMTHVALMRGQFYGDKNWWIMEGVAELAAHPQGLTAGDAPANTRRFIRNGWDRKLPFDGPADDDSDATVSALYNIAFLAVKRLEDRFGRERLMKFHDSLLGGGGYDFASSTFLGAPWADVQADLISRIRAY